MFCNNINKIKNYCKQFLLYWIIDKYVQLFHFDNFKNLNKNLTNDSDFLYYALTYKLQIVALGSWGFNK